MLDADGAIYLIFVTPQMSPQMAFPNDGMRFQENEQRFTIPAGNGRVRHLPIKELTFGIDLRRARLGG